MVTVYAIYDRVVKEIYVGITANLERRIKEHKRGQTQYTKKFKDAVLFYKENVIDYKIARKREKYLKSGCGKEFLKKHMRV